MERWDRFRYMRELRPDGKERWHVFEDGDALGYIVKLRRGSWNAWADGPHRVLVREALPTRVDAAAALARWVREETEAWEAANPLCGICKFRHPRTMDCAFPPAPPVVEYHPEDDPYKAESTQERLRDASSRPWDVT